MDNKTNAILIFINIWARNILTTFSEKLLQLKNAIPGLKVITEHYNKMICINGSDWRREGPVEELSREIPMVSFEEVANAIPGWKSMGANYEKKRFEENWEGATT